MELEIQLFLAFWARVVLIMNTISMALSFLTCSPYPSLVNKIPFHRNCFVFFTINSLLFIVEIKKKNVKGK